MRCRLANWYVIFSCACVPASAWSAETPQAWVQRNLVEIVEFYRQLHTNPELSFQEKETAARLVQRWRDAGIQVTPGIGGHGVVGILSNGDGPTVMLRSDMDALPVREATGLVYASTVTVQNETGAQVGVMHACGHDIHMANLTGVARYLSENQNLWKGTLMLIGQPAEERGAGAAAMLKDGLFERFSKPDYAVALHVVAYRTGYSLANVDSVDIKVHGRGGHGAYPHTAIDPIVQAAELVMSLQTIVSREVKPMEPAVVTVGSIHGGTKTQRHRRHMRTSTDRSQLYGRSPHANSQRNSSPRQGNCHCLQCPRRRGGHF